MNLTCPGCGFRTIGDTAYGSYEICAVCGWEDDPVQLANPCSGGGANKESLHECQRVFATRQVETIPEFERDPAWRPLNEEEISFFQSAARRKHYTFPGETAPKSAYWRRISPQPESSTD